MRLRPPVLVTRESPAEVRTAFLDAGFDETRPGHFSKVSFFLREKDMPKAPDSSTQLTDPGAPGEVKEDEDDESELIDSWESDNEEVLFELHRCSDHYEVLAMNGAEDEEDEDMPTVCLAWSAADLDDVIDILTQIRKAMR
jgi:hypothetical protein